MIVQSAIEYARLYSTLDAVAVLLTSLLTERSLEPARMLGSRTQAELNLR